MIEIIIPGELRGKGRPRFGNGRTFTDTKTVNAEAWVRACAVSVFRGAPLDGPLALSIEIGVPVPKSWPKKRRADALAGAIWPTGKPDLDNQIKLVGDALNGLIWRDDSQVIRVQAVRRYVEQPQAVLTVTEV